MENNSNKSEMISSNNKKDTLGKKSYNPIFDQNLQDAQITYENEINKKHNARYKKNNSFQENIESENRSDFFDEKHNTQELDLKKSKNKTEEEKSEISTQRVLDTEEELNNFSKTQAKSYSIFNSYVYAYDQNIDDAQRLFDENIKKEQKERYEKNISDNYRKPYCNSGYFKNNDYEDLSNINSQKEYSKAITNDSKTVKSNVGNLADFGRTIQRGTMMYIYNTSTESTDARRGADEYRDIYNLSVKPVLDTTRRTMGIAMKSQLIKSFEEAIPILIEAKILDKDYVIPTSKRDLTETMLRLNRYARRNNLVNMKLLEDPAITLKPYSKRGQYLLKKALENKNLKRSDKYVLNLLLNYSRYQTISGIKNFRGIRYLSRISTRFARRDQTMYTALTISLFTQRAIYLYRVSKMFARNLFMTSKLATKKAYKRFLEGHIKLLKANLTAKIESNENGKKILSYGKKIDITRKNTSKNIKNSAKKTKSFLRDPFHVKSNIKKIIHNGTKKIPGFKHVKKILNLLGKSTSKIMAGFSLVKTIILTGLMFILLTILVMMMIMYIMKSNFSFDAVEEKIRNKCLNQIQICFDEQNRNLSSYYGKYRNVSINFAEEKDHEEYQLPEHAPSSSFTETTNAAEILSMTQVRFDFDLASAKERDVLKYVKELYNGSHRTTVTERRETIKNDDGSTYDVVDADITLTTVYFNGLFDCKLTNKAPGIIAGNSITEKTWNYLITSGVPPIAAAGIMGNIQAESGFNPAIIEGGSGVGFGLCQWSYDRRAALENYAASKSKSPSDLQIQLEFLVSELTPGHFNAYHTGEDSYTKWYNAKTTDEATYYFMWGWERPLESAANASYNLRCNSAKMYYEMYKDNPIPTEDEKKNIS